jgi:predicted nucleotide-binding protein
MAVKKRFGFWDTFGDMVVDLHKSPSAGTMPLSTRLQLKGGASAAPPPTWKPNGIFQVAMVGSTPKYQEYSGGNWVDAPLEDPNALPPWVTPPTDAAKAPTSATGQTMTAALSPRSADEGDPKKVFLIHGRNSAAPEQMGIFLRSMGLEPVWFRDVRKTMGGTATIAGVVEQGMKLAHGILALFTPDEFSSLRSELRKPSDSGDHVERWQARPNVLFEAGMAFGKDRDRVAFVLFGDVTLFTDASGIHVYRPNNDHGPDSDRAQLRGLLAGGMHCTVDLHSDEWMRAGNFDDVMRGLSGVSPPQPFRP